MTRRDSKTFVVTYDEFNVVVAALIAARQYFESMMVVGAQHPDWFPTVAQGVIAQRVAHLDSVLTSLGFSADEVEG